MEKEFDLATASWDGLTDIILRQQAVGQGDVLITPFEDQFVPVLKVIGGQASVLAQSLKFSFR